MNKKQALFAVIGVLLLVSIACLGSGSDGESNGDASDLKATTESLEATQQAMSEQTQDQGEPESEEPESHPEYVDPVTGDSVSEPAASEEFDWDSYESGDVVYSTEFNGTTEDWEDGWIHFPVPSEKEKYSTWIKDGYLYVGIGETDTEIYLFYDPIYMPRGNADILVEAQTNNIGSVRNNNISVVCRANNDGWYEFSISSSGLWWIWKYHSSTGVYDILAKGGVPNYNKNVTEHMLSATCIDDELTFYYDGFQLKNGQVNDSSYQEGGIGVSVYAGNLTVVEVEFDWFEAQIP